MDYKRSVYNIEIDTLENGNVLIYNTFSGGFVELDKKSQDLYYNIENTYDCQVSTEIESMRSNGFVVEKEIDEYARMQTLGNFIRFNPDILSLTIAPTINCNMACPYCYEKKTNKRMDENIIEGLVNFVNKSLDSKKYKGLMIMWYGGEPLLEKEIIKKLSKLFIQSCIERNVIYSAAIVTNGSLLDYETGKMLKEECNVSFAQITIDGLKETNNKRRLLKNGDDSFGIIIDNIDLCKDLLKIMIRVNIDKTNIDEADDLINFLYRTFNHNSNVRVYFAPISKQTEFCNVKSDTCYSSQEFGKIEPVLLEKLKTIAKQNDISISIPYPNSMFLACQAVGIGSYVVDPEGMIYKCWDEIGVKESAVGDIFKGLPLNKQALDWLSLQLPEECNKCEYLPICGGGCPYQRLNNNNKPICHFRRFSFINNLKLCYSHYLEKEKATNVI